MCALETISALKTWTLVPSLLMALERFVCPSSFAKHTT